MQMVSEAALRLHFSDHQKIAVAAGVAAETECVWPGCGKAFSRCDTVQRCLKRHNLRARRGV
ncbi:hypothetical protein F4678DRAFT_455005 [Xylaria arbuscula]|nr:hypothetical protein F4678DRAFT_455005 [Xylaria arbuscula]